MWRKIAIIRATPTMVFVKASLDRKVGASDMTVRIYDRHFFFFQKIPEEETGPCPEWMGVFACTLLSGVGQGVTGVGLGLCQRPVTRILTTGLVCFPFAKFAMRRWKIYRNAVKLCRQIMTYPAALLCQSCFQHDYQGVMHVSTGTAFMIGDAISKQREAPAAIFQDYHSLGACLVLLLF